MAHFLLVQPFLDGYGGGERVCHNVLKTLLAQEQLVDLLTVNFDAQRYRIITGEEFPKQTSVHSLEKKVEIKPPFTIYKRHRVIVELLKKYRDFLEYDYVFCSQASSPFETIYLKKAKKFIGYVHFPEIHYEYQRSSVKKKSYLWLYKRWIEQGIAKFDLIFCNSVYTKGNIERYWKKYGAKDPAVVYPPVNLTSFWCKTPLCKRHKRITYVARFISRKRHEIMKQLATDLPQYEFVSIGGATESDKEWISNFTNGLPQNYQVKTNLPQEELIETLQDSRIYTHLMEGEHFGIAPVEGLASGCIPLVHDSGGMKEFIPNEYRWQTYVELKEKIARYMDGSDEWENKRQKLWEKIAELNPETFQKNIWTNIKSLLYEQ